jgi:hypothetical protein
VVSRDERQEEGQEPLTGSAFPFVLFRQKAYLLTVAGREEDDRRNAGIERKRRPKHAQLGKRNAPSGDERYQRDQGRSSADETGSISA